MIESNEFHFPALPQPGDDLPPNSNGRLTSAVNDMVNQAMTEKDDQQSRKLNLMIHNLAEPASAEADLAQVKDLVETKLSIEDGIVITALNRLGRIRYDGKPRMVRIALQTLEMKRKILSCATKLRQLTDTDTFAKVYLKPDLTKKQQAQSKNLYLALQKQREDDPTNRYIIAKGEIINKGPVPLLQD